jgi:hypothetical protein
VQSQSQELERLSTDMEQLYRLSTTMQEPLSLREHLGRVLEAATRTGVIDRVYVWAVSAEADKLVNLAGAGFAADEWKDFEMMEIPLVEAGAMYKAFREGQPLLFDDANPLPRELYLNPRYLIKAIRTSRFLVIPMIARGEKPLEEASDVSRDGRYSGEAMVPRGPDIPPEAFWRGARLSSRRRRSSVSRRGARRCPWGHLRAAAEHRPGMAVGAQLEGSTVATAGS